MKAKSKTSATPAVKALTVSAAYIATLKATASADSKAAAAATTASQSLLLLGEKTAKEFEGEKRDDVRAAILPHFVAAYVAAKFDEDYAKQQLARTISFAFPGGKAQDEKIVKRAKENLERASKLNLGVNDRLKLANGGFVLDKKNEIVAVKTSGSGGHNRKTPKEEIIALDTASIVAAKAHKWTFQQMLNTFIETAIACEVKGAKEYSADSKA